MCQAESWGVGVSAQHEDVLRRYAHELETYELANIIGSRKFDDIVLNHVLDSLSCLIFAPLGRARSLIDVGSGGGLPGLPLRFVRPQLATTLVEATGKKAEFLRQVVESLGVEDVEVVNERAERVGREPEHRDLYEVATARAVATLDVISEYCVPLVRKGGYVISMKGVLDDWEVEAGKRAAHLLGAEISAVIEVPFLPDMPSKPRNLVVLRKLAETPDQYPRKDGVPRKRPLGGTKGK